MENRILRTSDKQSGNCFYLQHTEIDVDRPTKHEQHSFINIPKKQNDSFVKVERPPSFVYDQRTSSQNEQCCALHENLGRPLINDTNYYSEVEKSEIVTSSYFVGSYGQNSRYSADENTSQICVPKLSENTKTDCQRTKKKQKRRLSEPSYEAASYVDRYYDLLPSYSYCHHPFGPYVYYSPGNPGSAGSYSGSGSEGFRPTFPSNLHLFEQHGERIRLEKDK